MALLHVVRSISGLVELTQQILIYVVTAPNQIFNTQNDKQLVGHGGAHNLRHARLLGAFEFVEVNFGLTVWVRSGTDKVSSILSQRSAVMICFPSDFPLFKILRITAADTSG